MTISFLRRLQKLYETIDSGYKISGKNLRINLKEIVDCFMIRVSFRLTILSRFFVLPCCITGSALFCSDKRTSGAATKSAKIDKKASQEPKNAGRNRIHVIGHVFEYPTMYYLEIPDTLRQ